MKSVHYLAIKMKYTIYWKREGKWKRVRLGGGDSKLTDDPALVAVDRSRSGDVLFHDVEADGGRRRLASVDNRLSDSEPDLPRQKVRQQRRWRRQQSVLRQERLHARAEGASSGVTGCRKGQEVVEIGRDSPLHTLHRAAVHHHGLDQGRRSTEVFGFRESRK